MSVALSGLFQARINIDSSNEIFTMNNLPIINQLTMEVQRSDAAYILSANITDGTSLPPWVTQSMYFLPFTLATNSSVGKATTSLEAVTHGFGINTSCFPIGNASPKSMAAWATAVGSIDVTQAIPRQFSQGRRTICNNHNPGPYGSQNNSNAALEVLQTLSSTDSSMGVIDDGICDTLLLSGFLRANRTVSADNVKTDNPDDYDDINPTVLTTNKYSSLWMVCQPILHVAQYAVTVDCDGRVQKYDQVGAKEEDLSQFFSNGSSIISLINQTRRFWVASSNTSPYWHNDTFVDTWFGYFIKALSNSTDLIDPDQPVPPVAKVTPIIEDIYTRVFAITLGLNPTIFKAAPPDTMLQGTISTRLTRITISRPALDVTIALLALNVIVALLYYVRRPRRMLKQMPTTIASILELFDGSGLLGELRQGEGKPSKEWRIGYGRFVGTDGRPKIGIERRPFVVPFGRG